MVTTWCVGSFGPTRDQGQHHAAYCPGTDYAGCPFSPDSGEIDGDTESDDGEYETEQTPADLLNALKRESALFIFSPVSGFYLPFINDRLGRPWNDALKLFQCVRSGQRALPLLNRDDGFAVRGYTRRGRAVMLLPWWAHAAGVREPVPCLVRSLSSRLSKRPPHYHAGMVSVRLDGQIALDPPYRSGTSSTNCATHPRGACGWASQCPVVWVFCV